VEKERKTNGLLAMLAAATAMADKKYDLTVVSRLPNCSNSLFFFCLSASPIYVAKRNRNPHTHAPDMS